MIDYEKAKRVLKAFENNQLTLGAVESLTGGLFSATICAIPGASKVFKGALVAYNIEQKISLLGMDRQFIKDNGVVSKEVARDMAIRGRRILASDVCVSFTGNAGPTKEEGQAPVGRVEMCISTRFGLVDFQQDYALTRNEMREACVDMMLDHLIAVFES